MSVITPRPALLVVGLVLLLILPGRQGRSDVSDVVFAVDFTDYSGGSEMNWLKGKGFTPEQDMKNERRITLANSDRALVMEAKAPSLGLLVNEVDVVGYSRIRIEWGVQSFPQGASYEQGVRSDAVMVYVFFGNEKLSSGSLLIPNSPYFLGLFLCESDRTGYPYIGQYFKLGGRYVCLQRTTAGTAVTSEFAIADAFLRFFERDEILAVSGIAIAIDTKSAKGDGSAKAFIRRIAFLR